MKVKEVASLVGISVRTLHHYDAIGLLNPEEMTDAGYRIYSEKDLERLQQILFFRELDFPLKKIKEILASPSFNQEEALALHRKMLLEKRASIDKMVRTIDKTIEYKKGERRMSAEEKFEGFDFSKNPYEEKARKRWGDEAVDQSNAKLNNMSKGEKKKFEEKFNAIYAGLAEVRHLDPGSETAQEKIEEWFYFLNDMGSYSLDAFKGLGQMYVDDQRFTKNIDQFGEGLALFMRDAMGIYADRRK
ncbi:MerR family transcriptional regulator [Oceanobacillus manasiensis]|uniref:MerR family transcriptional regulator n=1 Tax=Oceanobacillus manasiensis TaxID=586413 RepID=UPI000AD98258|nr:MerR family transcriptional regulator [Oceanobacillus manasiensis]